MQLTSVLSPATRVLDVGVTDPELALALAAAGHPRYLGLARPAHLAGLRERAPQLASRLHPLTSPEQGLRNDTDLLVLRGPFSRLLWSFGRLEHVSHVAVPAGPGSAEALVAATVGRAAGRLRDLGRTRVGGETFHLVQVTSPRPDRTRRYLSPVLGVSGLFRRLDEARIDYVVLRWFDDLPDMDPGEDLDVLVADEHLVRMQELLAEEPGTVAVDLYSETGLPGSDYRGVAYYPPVLARQLLQRAVRHDSGARVPGPQEHRRSLGYHAAYHKGPTSGLPSTLLQTVAEPEHDYASTLRRLAQQVGAPPPGSLEELDEQLAQDGWRPPMDTVRRLSAGNAWLAARFPAAASTGVDPPEPAVFLVRQKALDLFDLAQVVAMLAHYGFEALLVQELDEASRQRCASQLRGGNWGRGPHPVSGGGPAAVVVAAHYGPRRPRDAELARHPRLSNLDVLEAKLAVRAALEARTDPGERFNPLHSADDEHEAWEYAECAVPHAVADLREQVARRRAGYRTEVQVLDVLSQGRRAKVELVPGPDGPVVRKTFAPPFGRHLQRELQARAELGPAVTAVPPLLEAGPGWFTSPYYADALQPVWREERLVPLPVLRQMVAVLREIHALGLDVLDAKPQNFLLDPERGLKLIDLEFLHRYDGEPPAFVDSYCFRGVPADFAGDVPVSDWDYEHRWRRVTGLPLRVLVDGSPAAQRLHRAVFLLSPTAKGSPVRKALRPLRRGAARARHRANQGFDLWIGLRTGRLSEGGA